MFIYLKNKLKQEENEQTQSYSVEITHMNDEISKYEQTNHIALNDTMVDGEIKKVEEQISTLQTQQNQVFNKIFKKKALNEQIQQRNNYLIYLHQRVNRKRLMQEKLRHDEMIEAKYESCKTIKDLGLTFTDAQKIMAADGVPMILDENDKALTSNVESYRGLQDFVLVHKTRYCPQQGIIKTSSNATESSGRDTIHFSVNGEVTPNNGGDWDNCKYTVMIPYDKAPLGQLRDYSVADTFFEGNIELPEGTILICPFDEAEMAQKENPKVTVMGYNYDKSSGKSPSSLGYAQALIGTMGYANHSAGMWTWDDKSEKGEDKAILFYDMFNKVKASNPEVFYGGISKAAHGNTIYITTEAILQVARNNCRLLDDAIANEQEITYSYFGDKIHDLAGNIEIDGIDTKTGKSFLRTRMETVVSKYVTLVEQKLQQHGLGFRDITKQNIQMVLNTCLDNKEKNSIVESTQIQPIISKDMPPEIIEKLAPNVDSIMQLVANELAYQSNTNVRDKKISEELQQNINQYNQSFSPSRMITMLDRRQYYVNDRVSLGVPMDNIGSEQEEIFLMNQQMNAIDQLNAKLQEYDLELDPQIKDQVCQILLYQQSHQNMNNTELKGLLGDYYNQHFDEYLQQNASQKDNVDNYINFIIQNDVATQLHDKVAENTVVRQQMDILSSKPCVRVEEVRALLGNVYDQEFDDYVQNNHITLAGNDYMDFITNKYLREDTKQNSR